MKCSTIKKSNHKKNDDNPSNQLASIAGAISETLSPLLRLVGMILRKSGTMSIKSAVDRTARTASIPNTPNRTRPIPTQTAASKMTKIFFTG